MIPISVAWSCLILVLGFALSCHAQKKDASLPAELQALKSYVGVWDAEIEVWPRGQEAPSIKFKGVETNRAYGDYWIASDFDSEFNGQTTKMHSIIGYDLDEEKLIGKVIDHGPYAASMTGDYDAESNTVTWMAQAKMPNGSPMIQKTTVTQKSADERELVLFMPKKGAEGKDAFAKFMTIKFVKRK